jgi:mRNA interferase MazF
MHNWLRTVIVAPMTSQDRAAPFRIPVVFQRKSGLILLDQIRSLDKQRLVKRLGAIKPDTLAATLGTLQEVFAE